MSNRSDSSEKIDDYIKGVPQAKTLADDFKISLKKTDEISDRLQAEADRVTAKVKLIVDQEIEEAQARADFTQAELLKWKKNWEEALLPLGLPVGTFSDDANDVMDEHHDLFERN